MKSERKRKDNNNKRVMAGSIKIKIINFIIKINISDDVGSNTADLFQFKNVRILNITRVDLRQIWVTSSSLHHHFKLSYHTRKCLFLS